MERSSKNNPCTNGSNTRTCWYAYYFRRIGTDSWCRWGLFLPFFSFSSSFYMLHRLSDHLKKTFSLYNWDESIFEFNRKVHDLHIWSLTLDHPAVAVHLAVSHSTDVHETSLPHTKQNKEGLKILIFFFLYKIFNSLSQSLIAFIKKFFYYYKLEMAMTVMRKARHTLRKHGLHHATIQVLECTSPFAKSTKKN